MTYSANWGRTLFVPLKTMNRPKKIPGKKVSQDRLRSANYWLLKLGLWWLDVARFDREGNRLPNSIGGITISAF